MADREFVADIGRIEELSDACLPQLLSRHSHHFPIPKHYDRGIGPYGMLTRKTRGAAYRDHRCRQVLVPGFRQPFFSHGGCFSPFKQYRLFARAII